MVALRPPAEVMRLARLGSFHATRLSFMPALLRLMANEKWRFERARWEIDASGVGRAVYSVHGPERSYSLVCFAHDLPDEMRSDRVIATAWDATFTLYDGVPSDADIARLAENVPKQEAGRITAAELTLSRANRSARLFDTVVAALADGRQPDADEIAGVGYLMRTTAVYGSGKFGAADRDKICDRPELRLPFRAEMLTVWLIRAFVLDLVEHLARARGGEKAVALAPEIRRSLGIGNSTGLGMAPFLINHPTLFNNWILVRETALKRVREIEAAEIDHVDAFRVALAAAISNAELWTSAHPLQLEKLTDLRRDLARIKAHVVRADVFAGRHPWNALWEWAEKTLSLEGQEALVAVMLEPHGALIDGLCDCMDADEDAAFMIDGAMPLRELRALMEANYDWALGIDFEDPAATARFWYVSEEKLEPRLGERADEPGSELEQPLASGRDVRMLWDVVADDASGYSDVAALLRERGDLRHIVRRVQMSAAYPYTEIRDNLIASEMLPIDLLRCKLSFFGAARFDPRSDRWVRICMFQDAPFPDELLETA